MGLQNSVFGEVGGFGQPLVRLGLLEDTSGLARNDDVVRVILAMHHAAYDGVSMHIVLEAFGAGLAGAGHDGVRATRFRSYIGHAIYGRTLEDDDMLLFWTAQLAGADCTHFSLPPARAAVDRDWPVASSVASARAPMDLGDAEARPAALAHAAWALTLSHYTGNADVVFGAILSDRESLSDSVEGLETVAGPTIASVPARICIDYDMLSRDFVAKTQRQLLDMERFSHLDIQTIVRTSPSARHACSFGNILVVQPVVASHDDVIGRRHR
ncbi:hypothetical protein LZ30DRAFT_786714 [Colletotrichum cereale]|nr:hypothetical protein LZ30DRAFT_786714 [Colletotrichum cereale]